jgi:hypothetical protein
MMSQPRLKASISILQIWNVIIRPTISVSYGQDWIYNTMYAGALYHELEIFLEVNFSWDK